MAPPWAKIEAPPRAEIGAPRLHHPVPRMEELRLHHPCEMA
uniref:Uncharacterized protein n=1 Tax=Fagus sylvatica TaxID=28930 RepID=A0A2N9HIP2_FAGSY